MRELIESAGARRMLMVGERIEDVYHYVAPLGRPVKELILSTEWVSTETFAGGITAAAEHARAVCGHVATWSDRCVRKERWVEVAHARKLFQVQHPVEMIDEPFPVGRYDVFAVIDYGHGLHPRIQPAGAHEFIALNVQTNSANYGFNLVGEHDRVDYLVLDELEARLSTGNRAGPLTDSIMALRRNAAKLVITLGRNGAMGSSDEHPCVSLPAFTTRVVDTMGAGDCFFAVTAPLAREATIPQLLRIGNAAAALKTQTLGHREPVTRAALIEYLEAHGTR